jgi:hypothetical protein
MRLKSGAQYTGGRRPSAKEAFRSADRAFRRIAVAVGTRGA